MPPSTHAHLTIFKKLALVKADLSTFDSDVVVISVLIELLICDEKMP